MASPNKAYSESDMTSVGQDDKTPPSYVATRTKRKRNEDLDFDAFKEEIKSMIESFIQKQETESVSVGPSLREIRQSISNIESSMSLLSAQNEDLKKKLNLVEAQSKKDHDYISLLEDKLEEMNRETRKSHIEIRNVPSKPKETQEDLLNLTVELSKTVNCPEFSKNMVKDIFRVKRKDNDKTIVVEL